MEGYWVFDTFMMKASMEGAWTVSEGRASESKKETVFGLCP